MFNEQPDGQFSINSNLSHNQVDHKLNISLNAFVLSELPTARLRNARPGVGTPHPDKSLFSSRSHRIRLTDMSMFSHCHAPNRMSTTCMRTSGSKQGVTEKGSADDEQGLRVGDAGIEPATPSV